MIDYFLSPGVLFVTQTLLFVVTIFFIYIARKIIYNFLKQLLNKRDLYIILALVILSWIIRLLYLGEWYYTNDEYMYIDSAKELYSSYDIQWYTRVIWWPFLLSLILPIFWFSSIAGVIFSLLLSVWTIALLYVIIYYIFNNRHIALYASILFSVLPFHVFWSDKLETNIPSLFFILLSILWCLIYSNTQNLKIFLASIFVTVFATTFRGENIVLYIPLCVLVITHFKTFFQPIKNFYISVIVWISAMLLASANYLNQYFFTNSQSWNYWQGDNISLDSFFDNNSFFLEGFFDNRLLFFYDFIVLLGIFYGWYCVYTKRIQIRWMGLILFLLPFCGIYIMYNLIWLQYVYGVDRLFMEVYPIYALFFGIGVFFIWNILYQYVSNKWKCVVYILLIWLVFSNVLFAGNYKQISEHHSLQMSLSQEFSNYYDNKCVYIVFKPFYYNWYVDGFNYSYNYEFISSETLREKLFNNFSCVMFIDDKFCNDHSPGNKFSWPDKRNSNSYCKDIKNTFPLSEIVTYQWENYRYWIYQIISDIKK